MPRGYVSCSECIGKKVVACNCTGGCNELCNDELLLINGGVLLALITFGIVISPWLLVPAAITGVCLLIAVIYLGFRQTYEYLSKNINNRFSYEKV